MWSVPDDVAGMCPSDCGGYKGHGGQPEEFHHITAFRCIRPQKNSAILDANTDLWFSFLHSKYNRKLPKTSIQVRSSSAVDKAPVSVKNPKPEFPVLLFKRQVSRASKDMSSDAYSEADRHSSASSTSSIRSSMSAMKRRAQDAFSRKSSEEKIAEQERKRLWKERRNAKSPAFGYGATPGYVTLGY